MGTWNKIKLSFLLSMVFTLFVLLILVFVLIFNNTMEYIETDKRICFSEMSFDISNISTNRNEIRKEIGELLGVNVYFYRETKLENAMGVCNPFIREVVLSTDLNDMEYIETICHELCHIKYFTINERFTQYKTWETLYNTNKYKPVANYILYKMSRNKYYKDYNCYYQILEYLEVLENGKRNM